MTLIEKDETFIEGRIRWKAKQYSVPNAKTYFANEWPNLAAPLLARVPNDSEIGIPILVFTTEGHDWSVLGTKGIGGEIDGSWREAQYCDIDHASFLKGQQG